MEMNDDMPAFDKPPVIEVVCGVLFRPIESLLAPHLGVLWERFKQEYPTCREVPPLAPVTERYDEDVALSEVYEFTDRPPLPRTWFVHESENGIIQIQRDRLLHNWKRVRPDDAYPRYASVIQMFRDRLDVFEAFLRDSELGTVVPEQYEMTYVNHIPCGEGFASITEVGSVFPDFSWRSRRDRFLGVPESVSWKTVFALPEQAGRLYATIRSGLRRDDDTPILLFELTARGIGKQRTKSDMWEWFDLAHEWIVRAFTELTADGMHKSVWKRTK